MNANIQMKYEICVNVGLDETINIQIILPILKINNIQIIQDNFFDTFTIRTKESGMD